MPRKYRYNVSAAALLEPARDAVFFEDWDATLDLRNHDLLAAELSRLAYAGEAVVEEALNRMGFTLVGSLGGETLAARAGTRGTQGFVAAHEGLGLAAVAFRGTEADRFEDLASDLSTLQTDFPGGGRVHAGFHAAYLTVHDRLGMLLERAGGRLLVTGHSLGGALATLAAASQSRVPDALITFGTPRVGDGRFGAALEARLAAGAVRRFVHCCDVVARLPPERYDAAHFSALFEELGGFEMLGPLAGRAARVAADLAAGALDASFRVLGATVEFAHVGSPLYLSAGGALAVTAPDEERARDQRAARAGYPHATGPQLAELEARFLALFTAAAGSGALRAFVRDLFAIVRVDPVPLRDLADHSPINYLSARTGRAADTE
jgi:hypothetical protein